ncbi:adenosylcobinamide-GDP ribazoletransferase [Desulfovibrio sp. Fe33]|uniref:adenosylcobinamide-GDP ribazoletransferase n=1 Tax=Desulfovibrio sp. Fe33 TaxID=3020842 RepID=UPI00234C1F6C|nr:adenosylcobinamide-GDP ribazoletransferase [Desulfovibrio sp. Fe33]
MLRDFVDTLGFLTRLAPARVISEPAMNRCMRWMAPAGLVLGVVIVLPLWLGLFGNSPWIQAWLMVAASIYLTRGLHMDGLADVCDAVTTHTDPVRFWEVVKDSHTGAFGAMGLVMAAAGQILLFHTMLSRGEYWAAAWVFVLGRAAAVWLGYHVRHLVRPGLGKLYVDGATLGVALATTLFAFVTGLVMAGFAATLASTVIATAVLLGLFRLADKVGGANGDFLGCAVILGELAAGLGFALVA